jgi:hypothetical protein
VTEIVEFGREPRGQRSLPTLLLIALVVVAVVVVAVKSATGHGHARHASAYLVPVMVLHVGHPLLGERSPGWELYGLGSDVVVTVSPAAGQITTTALPPPEGSGPVAFVLGPDEAIVRPLDNVPGFVVPDGQPARPLTGVLRGGGLLLPGPSPSQHWFVPANSNSVLLVGPDAHPTVIRLPRQWVAQSAMSDGRGDLLVSNQNGEQYDLGPGWLRPAGAMLVAGGPTRWLGLACPDVRCHDVVLDSPTGPARPLAGQPVHVESDGQAATVVETSGGPPSSATAVRLLTAPWPYEPGTVAPDGKTAAIVVASGNDNVALDEINLSTGAITPVGVPVNQQASSQTLAWSPDSRWLFVLAANGQLVAVDARTGRPQSLGVTLPRLSAIIVRDS